MSKDVKVGDVCLTVNTKHPAVNDGVLVVITAVDHTSRDARGNSTPYLIKRVDGQPHISTTCRQTGKQRWLSNTSAWCARYKLKPIDGDAVDERDQVRAPLEVSA